jgi:heat shock protein HslJ
MTGTYTVTGAVLNAQQFATTAMACIDTAVADQETWFAAFVAASPTFTLADGTLTLTDGTDTVVFASEPSGAETLQSTGWKLTDVMTPSGGDVTAIDTSLTAWVRFADGEVTFDNSCNAGSGTAEIADQTITFGPLQSTLILCDGPSGAVETAMNAVLQGVAPYQVTTESSPARLEIMTEDGLTVLRLQADPTVGADAFPSASASATAPSSG